MCQRLGSCWITNQPLALSTIKNYWNIHICRDGYMEIHSNVGVTSTIMVCDLQGYWISITDTILGPNVWSIKSKTVHSAEQQPCQDYLTNWQLSHHYIRLQRPGSGRRHHVSQSNTFFHDSLSAHQVWHHWDAKEPAKLDKSLHPSNKSNASRWNADSKLNRSSSLMHYQCLGW